MCAGLYGHPVYVLLTTMQKWTVRK